MWRNWQTRRSQKPVMVTSWRFKSSHPHHVFKGESKGFALLIGFGLVSTTCGLVSTTCGSGWLTQENDDRSVSSARNGALSTLPALQLSANQYSDSRDDRQNNRRPDRLPHFLHCFEVRNVAGSGGAGQVPLCHNCRNPQEQADDNCN